MPITLTTPYDPGDADTTTYAQVEVTGLRENKQAKFFRFYCEYGNTVGSEFVPGVVGYQQFVAQHADYNTIKATVSTYMEPGYTCLYRGIYQWLIDKGYYAGTY